MNFFAALRSAWRALAANTLRSILTMLQQIKQHQPARILLRSSTHGPEHRHLFGESPAKPGIAVKQTQQFGFLRFGQTTVLPSFEKFRESGFQIHIAPLMMQSFNWPFARICSM